MIVFKADLFRSMGEFAESVRQTSSQARAIAPAPGFDRVRVPGDPEAEARADHRRSGIPIADDIWGMLTENAELLGVEIS